MRTRRVLDNLTAYHPGIKLPGVVKLSSNENPLGTAPAALEAIRHTISGAAGVSVYPDGAATELRTRLASRLDLDQHGMGPENLVVGNGSDEVMVLAAAAYLDPGSEVITGKHTFSQYEFSALLFDGSVIRTEMPDGTFDPGELLRSVTAGTRIVFICNPNNPTGTYLPGPVISAFLEAIDPSILVVMDEAYREYVTAPDFPDAVKLVSRHDNLLVLRTFSKIYGLAGMRVGYGLGNRKIIAALEKVKPPFNVGTAAQEAAVAALDDIEFVERSIELNTRGKAEYYHRLDRLGGTGEIGAGIRYYRSEANFICLELPFPSGVAYDHLRKRGFTIRRLDSFGLPNAIRITISTPEHNAAVLDALEELVPADQGQATT